MRKSIPAVLLISLSTSAAIVSGCADSDDDANATPQPDATGTDTGGTTGGDTGDTGDTGGTTGGTTGDDVEADPVRGRYIVDVLGACSDCHTPRGPDGAHDPARYLAGANCFFDVDPADPDVGCLTTGNLTSHGTGLLNRTDQEVKDMILTGTRPDGTFLHPAMPYWTFGNMSEQDADNVVAFLRTVAAVNHRVPPSQPPFAMVPAPATRVDLNLVPMPDPAYPNQEEALAGRYIAANIGVCLECHTPENPPGTPEPRDLSRAFQGGIEYPAAMLGLPVPPFPEFIYSANLTPEPTTGTGGYDVAQIVRALKEGIDEEGNGLCPPMPAGPMGPYANLTDADAAALGHFLLSIPPVLTDHPNECTAPGAPLD